jgi:hypothetical protein
MPPRFYPPAPIKNELFFKIFVIKKEKHKNRKIKNHEKIETICSDLLYFENKPTCFNSIARPPKYFVCWGFKKKVSSALSIV